MTDHVLPQQAAMTLPIKRCLTSRRVQFWLCQAIGWLGYGFFVSLSEFLWDKDDGGIPWQYPLFSLITGLLLSWAMHPVLKRSLQWPGWWRWPASVLCVVVAAGIWSAAKMLVYSVRHGKTEMLEWINYFSWFTYSFFILLSWAALYFGISFYRLWQQEQRRTLQAQAQAHLAQLRMLQYQLNPHFLFNTLNAITTLVLEQQTQQADRMLSGLSRLLRYALEQNAQQPVPLSTELEALQWYLDIEQQRFTDDLTVHWHISAAAQRQSVPSLLLQPLVENAVIHGMDANGQREISVSAEVVGEALELVISDRGEGMDGVGQQPLPLEQFRSRLGVGLSNVLERLDVTYHGQAQVWLQDHQPGLSLGISLPLQTVPVAPAPASRVSLV
ncbi:sensor histidine kinase [Bacterioplanes sanyensis]|uniref:Sensor histidine kinase n=1 Tax=Bacterioplanes sanyensis TaxID=1249553 RepID=A0A222FIT5_9GAMM|nr:histidine kinase [Bacterioplanes sanyensis]ASP38331.1 sensor histidine kinase [Bacterioplanes sanyensis]